MNFYRRNLILINSLLFLGVVSGLTYTAIAWSNGKTGQTQAGCTCHSSQPNNNTTVTLTSGSGSFTFEPESETTFTVLVENSGMSKAGMNVGVKTTETSGTNVGSLTTGTGTKIKDGEVTHNGAQTMSSGKYTFTFDWEAPSQHGEYWIRGACNAVNGNGNNSGDQWNRFETQKIIVAGVTVLSPNGGENWCVNTTQTIKWDSDGLENVKIEVSTNGGSNWENIVASTSAASGSFDWTIPGNFTAGSNNLIRVSDAAKASRNDISANSFTVSGEVTITSQPQNDVTCTGQAFSFEVETSGSGNSYQWRKNGQNINGATQSSFSRASALLDDAGTYDCTITTSCGDLLTSESATLEVFVSPTVAMQPSNVSGCEGEAITIEAEITGEVSQLQWLKDNQPIAGATNMTYVISSLNVSDEGGYKLVATSAKCDNEISTLTANVALNKPVSFTEQPSSTNACQGTEVKFTPKITGTANAFQWYKDDVKVSGAISRDLTINDASAEDAGSYKLEVTSACDEIVVSEIATLTINVAPAIVIHPDSKEIFEGSNAVLFVVATNEGGSVEDLTYQWKKDGNAIDGATDSTYILSNAKLTDSGNYSVTVTNSCQLSVASNEAQINVLEDNGGPAIASLVEFIDFLEVPINESKTLKTNNAIANVGDEQLTISEINIIGPDATNFELISPALPANVSPEGMLDLEIKFTATKQGLHQAQITFVSNSVNQVTIPIRGIGKSNGTLVSSVSELLFGDVVINDPASRSLTISNPTLQDIEITATEFTSNAFMTSDIAGTTLAPSAQLEIEVTFNPSELKSYDETLTISSDDGGQIVIALKANAVQSSVSYGIANLTDAISYPNPAESNISFELVFDTRAEYSITIADMNGNTVKNFQNYSNIGKNIITWDARDSNGSKLSSGSYYAIVKVGRNIETIPVIIN